MAKNKIEVVSTGMKDILNDLKRLGDDMPSIVMQATEAAQQVVENAMRREWVGIAGGTSNDFVYQSIGKSTKFGSNMTDVVGTIGVYNIDSVNAAFGRTKHDLNAAQIAYWVEFGTSRLREGGRKKKGVEYDPSQLITVAGKPFMSNAYYRTTSEQEAAFAKKIEELTS